MATTVDDFRTNGQFVMGGGWAGNVSPPIPQSVIEQQDLRPFAVPLTEFVVWDAMHTNLPGTSATDDLALTSNGITDSPTIQTSDLKAAGATTRYASRLFPVPPEYVAGQTLVLRFHAGMKTTVADTTATIDVEAFKSDETEGISADLVLTGATTINSLVLADKDFIVNPATLSPGDMLLVRVAVAINDGATGAAVIGMIGSATLACDCKG